MDTWNPRLRLIPNISGAFRNFYTRGRGAKQLLRSFRGGAKLPCHTLTMYISREGGEGLARGRMPLNAPLNTVHVGLLCRETRLLLSTHDRVQPPLELVYLFLTNLLLWQTDSD